MSKCVDSWHFFSTIFSLAPVRKGETTLPVYTSLISRAVSPLSSFNAVFPTRARTTLADTPLFFLFQNECFVINIIHERNVIKYQI